MWIWHRAAGAVRRHQDPTFEPPVTVDLGCARTGRAEDRARERQGDIEFGKLGGSEAGREGVGTQIYGEVDSLGQVAVEETR
jgi:hypothetical protein